MQVSWRSHLGASAPTELTPGVPLSPLTAPLSLVVAMHEVHARAKGKQLDARMLKYVFYDAGFCRGCPASEIEQRKSELRAEMGKDFERLSKLHDAHKAEVQRCFDKSATKDIGSVLLARSGKEAYERRALTNCIDYTKAVAHRAFLHGLRPDDVRFFWTMVEDGYRKMCPTKDGQPAIPPRPFVHTIMAFRRRGEWWLINPEDPASKVSRLGKTLPERLGATYEFAAPEVIRGKRLIFAGHYPFAPFMDAIAGQTLMNITASGRSSTDAADFVCR